MELALPGSATPTGLPHLGNTCEDCWALNSKNSETQKLGNPTKKSSSEIQISTTKCVLIKVYKTVLTRFNKIKRKIFWLDFLSFRLLGKGSYQGSKATLPPLFGQLKRKTATKQYKFEITSSRAFIQPEVLQKYNPI